MNKREAKARLESWRMNKSNGEDLYDVVLALLEGDIEDE